MRFLRVQVKMHFGHQDAPGQKEKGGVSQVSSIKRQSRGLEKWIRVEMIQRTEFRSQAQTEMQGCNSQTVIPVLGRQETLD